MSQSRANMEAGNAERNLRTPSRLGHGEPHSGSGLHFKKLFNDEPTKRTLHAHHDHDHDHGSDYGSSEGRDSAPRPLPPMKPRPLPPMSGPDGHADDHPPPPPHGLMGGGDHDYMDRGRGPHGGPPRHHGPHPYEYPQSSPMFQNEGDVDVLKATMDMLKTPHSMDNRDAALALVENIQMNCAYDFDSYCSDVDASGFSAMFTFIDMPNVFGINKLFASTGDDTDFGQLGIGAPPGGGIDAPPCGMLDFIFGNSKPVEEEMIVFSDPAEEFSTSASKSESESESARSLFVEDGDDGDDVDGDGDAYAKDDGGDGDDGTILIVDFGSQIRSSGDGASFGMSGGSMRIGGEHEYRNEKEHKDHISEAYDGPNNDYYVGGSLGYGTSGDQCMYANLANLSPNCQQAIQQASNFRHEYWGEEQNYHHTPLVFFLLLMLTVLGICVYRKRCSKQGKERRKATDDAQSVLEAIYADPNLKNTVESAYGQELPPLVSNLPKLPKFCGIVCRMVGLFLAVCFISNTSVHITGALFHNIVFRNDDGEEHPPPKPLVVLVLLVVIAVQALLAVFLVRCGRYVCGRCCCRGSDNTDATVSSSPSSAAGSAITRTMTRLASYVPTMQSNITAATGFMRSSPSTANDTGYAPLLDDDSYYRAANGTSEMTTFTPTQPTAQTGTLLGAPSAPSQYAPQHAQYYTGVPVQMPGNTRYTYNN